MNAQQLAVKISADWFINGAKPSDAKTTVREVEVKLANFKQVARACGVDCPFDWDTALEAAELIAEKVNSAIDAANNYDA